MASMKPTARKGDKIADAIYRDLQGQILRNELPAGGRLPGERDLAVRYETNRNTLREAFRRLEQARLITVRHGQGVTVADFRKTGTMELLWPFLEAGPNPSEAVHILEDILPARLLVIEHAARVAVQRADRSDIERVTGVSRLLIAAHERGDRQVLGATFHAWLDAIVDASHSVAIRWIANPFLDAYREILVRFPALWVLEESFPKHLNEFIRSLRDGDERRAAAAIRSYYERVDSMFMDTVRGVMVQGPTVGNGEKDPADKGRTSGKRSA